jgi:hypothetical protein
VVAPAARQITYHRLAVTVPASWPLNDISGENLPQSDTVILPIGVAGCACGGAPDVTSVRFGATTDRPPKLTAPHQRGATIDGVHATETTGRIRNDTVVFLVIAAADASVTIQSPQPGEVQRLIATLRVVDVDSVGCPTRSAYVPLRATRASGHTGAADALVPGIPSSLISCLYGSGLFSYGQAIAPDQIAATIAILDAAPLGFSRAASGSSQCSPSAPLSAALDRDDDAGDPGEQAEFVLVARYTSGPPVTVRARIGFCGELGATNGSRDAQVSPALLNLLLSFDKVDLSWPGKYRPA